MKKLYVLLLLSLLGGNLVALTAPSNVNLSVSLPGSYIEFEATAKNNDSNADGIEFKFLEYLDRGTCSGSGWRDAYFPNGSPVNPQKSTTTKLVGFYPNWYFAYVTVDPTFDKCYRTCTSECGIMTDYKQVKVEARAYKLSWYFWNGQMYSYYAYSSATTSSTLVQGTNFDNCSWNNC